LTAGHLTDTNYLYLDARESLVPRYSYTFLSNNRNNTTAGATEQQKKTTTTEQQERHIAAKT
jgi:hypothetical protein